jgi:glyoxylase-like metal-dependent hydrolase (beta-lactamase superfamily II)
MRRLAALLAVIPMLFPLTATAHDGRAALEGAAKAMGAGGLKSIQYTGGGSSFSIGQSQAPGMPWPKFNVTGFTRTVNYETASLREEATRSRAVMPPTGGGTPVMGEARQIFVVGGDLAWNVVGETAAPAPVALVERQFQLWSTPHGFIKAAIANNATVTGRTIAFTVPGRFSMKGTLDGRNLLEKVEGVYTNAVLGDMPVEVTYSEYKDFGGVQFPMRIRQSAGGFPSVDLALTDVKPNAAADIPVPDSIRQATMPYSRIVTEQPAPGVWYVAGGSHHSVVIEMTDHVIVVEGPLNDERATALLAEARKLVPGKPIRYVVNSHHHFDHSGGLRAFAAEGITVITHESSRAFFEKALSAPAAMTPDLQARTRKTPSVEGVRDRRTLTDGARTVEIYHMANSTHCDGLLMVHLPKERFLIQADAYTPAPPNAPAPTMVNPLSVNLDDNIKRLGLSVDQLLPLHGRIVPLAELTKAIGR